MKLVAILAGAALALVPTGTAFAGDTGLGQAYGNCRNSSAGGERAPLSPEIGKGKGNGGLQELRGVDCKDEQAPPATPPADLPEPPVGGTMDF